MEEIVLDNTDWKTRNLMYPSLTLMLTLPCPLQCLWHESVTLISTCLIVIITSHNPMSLTLITCSYVVAMPVLSKSTLYIPVCLPLAALESFMDQHCTSTKRSSQRCSSASLWLTCMHVELTYQLLRFVNADFRRCMWLLLCITHYNVKPFWAVFLLLGLWSWCSIQSDEKRNSVQEQKSLFEMTAWTHYSTH